MLLFIKNREDRWLLWLRILVCFCKFTSVFKVILQLYFVLIYFLNLFFIILHCHCHVHTGQVWVESDWAIWISQGLSLECLCDLNGIYRSQCLFSNDIIQYFIVSWLVSNFKSHCWLSFGPLKRRIWWEILCDILPKLLMNLLLDCFLLVVISAFIYKGLLYWRKSHRLIF